MNSRVFEIQNHEHFNAADSYDLIKMIPVNKGSHSLYIQKYILELLTYAIVHGEFCHISGATGTAKTSVIMAISMHSNFRLLCKYLGFKYKPIMLFEEDMVKYETPGELYQHRAIKNNETIDMPSSLARAMTNGMKHCSTHYIVIFTKELGRVLNGTVMNGLLNLVSKQTIILPNRVKIDGSQLCFIADSNYQDAEESEYTLCKFDNALKRRFTLNINLDYLSESEEIVVLRDILGEYYSQLDEKLIEKIVRLGKVIRQYKSEGNLMSVVAPTIYGYLACYKIAVALTVTTDIVVMNTLLGNASTEDKTLAESIILNVLNKPSSKAQHTLLEDTF
jgi:MoxR-like ATPase